MTDTSRRSFLKLTAGAVVIIAAPAIVRASSLMKVRPLLPYGWVEVKCQIVDTQYWLEALKQDEIDRVAWARHRVKLMKELIRPGLQAMPGTYDDAPEYWDKVLDKATYA